MDVKPSAGGPSKTEFGGNPKIAPDYPMRILIGLWLSVVVTAVDAFVPVTAAPLGLTPALRIASSARSKAALGVCRFRVFKFSSNPCSVLAAGKDISINYCTTCMRSANTQCNRRPPITLI